MTTLEKVKEYYDNEIRDIERSITMPLYEPKKLVECSIQRCLGVAFFVQELGEPYDKVGDLYEEVRNKLYDLLKGDK